MYIAWFFLRVSNFSQWLSQWLGLIALLAMLLALSGIIFVFLATLISQNFGPKTIWPTLVVFFPIVTVSCIYKLSGLRHGLSWSTTGGAILALAYFTAWLGIPLAVGAYVLKRLHSELPQKTVGLQMAIAWAACFGSLPIAFASGVLIDRFAALLGAV